jgi:type I restriction enzyme M protein
MLDAETRARIDSARDILVGKVPDPKSQVEQITIALIYKFMDDMDRQSEEFGGKPAFFTGQFKKYRWLQLLDKRLGGHERLLLYAEGIEKMNENKNIPQLFRDIFKGVFLPYRDPETLNLFLKEINGFCYDHSERLGDAYEYLLSVLGTQGDAGQFRTPRHIIDFIVAVVDPRKEETVLDPACGTAGFLISAYKHILKHNENLTPDERARLMTNFCGYDIAPDMVRLSRVNMYLHGFPSPVIHEYDALTSEERWDERYDVIMANPPFMTPKGGIRPHNRFAIKAKRSEVLFVDYIAEHLNPGGRAGVIVPEGIIFQSQNAYKNLRRMLVENYLWAVVSLPAGVFNPYSGVKTSILFLDRNLAKRTEEVLFVKIENDGFDLGAQRKPIEQNDLPVALKAIEAWKRNQKSPKHEIAHAVARKRLLESPDSNLSGDRYRQATTSNNGKWPMVNLANAAEIIMGTSPDGESYNAHGSGMPLINGPVEFGPTPFSETLVTKFTTNPTKICRKGDLILCVRGSTTGRMNIASCDACIGRGVAAIRSTHSPFLIHLLAGMQDRIHQIGSRSGSTFPNITFNDLSQIEIPLPPPAEQERLVAELDGYQQVIEAARQVVARYKPTIRIDPDWSMVNLGSFTTLVSSGSTPLGGKDNYFRDGVLFIRSQNVLVGRCDFSDAAFITSKMHQEMARSQVKTWDVLLNITGASIGRCAVYRQASDANVNQHVCIIRLDRDKMEPEYLSFFINQPSFQDYIMRIQSGASRQALNYQQIREFEIPVPPLDTQRQIVAELEAERKLVDANRELIARMEKKMQAKLAEIWGEPVGASASPPDGGTLTRSVSEEGPQSLPASSIRPPR